MSDCAIIEIKRFLVYIYIHDKNCMRVVYLLQLDMNI